MIQIGDTVRYLNSVGGGKVTRIDGKIAYVDDNGFETPFQIKELVVVLPAGHEKPQGAARLMFDQKAFDSGKAPGRQKATPAPAKEPELSKDITPAPAPLPPAPETDYGNRLTIALAFEPSDIKKLSEATFNAVLVNDSNYTLQFFLAGRAPECAEWSVIYQGDVQPNEIIDLAQFSHSTLGRIERIVFQAIAFKQGKDFDVKDPIAVMRKLDLTKFHKMHCFRPGRFFDSPVLEFPLINADRFQKTDLMKDKFWTYPAEAESGRKIIITGRDNVDKPRLSGKYIYRLTVSWDYESLPDGMPADADASVMEQATDLLLEETRRDTAAILTGIYTGDGRRDWVFYTRSLFIFQKILNRALESLPQLPLQIEAAEDCGWEEYLDMRAQTYIPDDEDFAGNPF